MALLLAFLIGLAGLVIASPAARAAEVDAIDRSSIRLSKLNEGEAALYLWSGVRIDANWRIPDQSGKAGDTFKLPLPKELGGSVGSFELKGGEGDSLTYGTCAVEYTQVICTFNANVENKNNVGGSLWVSSQVNTLIEVDKITFPLSSGPLQVPLPNGQKNIGYSPHVPSDIKKSGWFTGPDKNVIRWNIVVPGAKVADRSRMVITDTYGVAGSNLTVVKEYPKVFWIPNTPKCWNESHSSDCYHKIDSSSTPSLDVTVDDTKDVATATIDNKGQNFQADRLYMFALELRTDGPIPAGAQYTNKATVDAEQRTAKAVKSVSGGGTGSGDTVGHINIKKAVSGAQVSGDTTYPVKWSYEYKGQTRSGELALRADGTPETLNNVPNGAVVTLTEQVPAGGDIDYGDPAFSGEGVKDGVPDANSAQVTVAGLKTVEVNLTNQANPRLSTVEVTPGVCTPGSSEPAKPTVNVGSTEGITYSEPKITTSGDQVTVEVTATPASGKEIDDQHLPEGWKANGDGTYTFTKTVTQPQCVKTVSPVIPEVTPGVCPADATTPTQPTVTGIADTDEIDYSEPVIAASGDQVSVTVTAKPKAGYQFDTAKLPEGWSVVDGVATFTKTVTQPKCELPVAPTIDLGSCTPGSLTPSEPTATVAETPGISYSKPEVKVVDGKVTVTTTATAEAGHQFGGTMPEGWTRVDATTATYTVTKDQPVCQATEVPPVSPKVEPGVCVPGTDKPAQPTVELPTTPHLTYGEPKIEVSGKKATITVTATPEQGYAVKKADLPEGWKLNDDGTATYTSESDLPDCATPAPSPTPTPTATPTPAAPTPVTPLRPALPKTGS